MREKTLEEAVDATELTDMASGEVSKTIWDDGAVVVIGGEETLYLAMPDVSPHKLSSIGVEI